MNKKSFVILLICSIITGILTGCKGSTDSTGATVGTADVSDAGEALAQETAANTHGEENNAQTVNGIDISEKVVFTASVAAQATNGNWNEYPFVKELEERYNVDIQFEQMSVDIWGEKYPLLFASDELPDFFCSGNIDTTTYGSQGYLLPLENYISEELTPNIWKMMQETPTVKKASTEADGHIYAIRGADLSIQTRNQLYFFINSGWADKILGKTPETLEEFYTYLKGVRDNDMDNDGSASNEIPLGGYYKISNIDPMRAILAACGHTMTGNYVEAQEDGKVVFVPEIDDYKYFLQYMNRLWSEGLMDPDYFTQDNAMFNAKDAAMLYGAFGNASHYMNHDRVEDYSQYAHLAPMTSEINDRQIAPAVDCALVGYFSITNKCENPERLLMVMDWFFSEEGINKCVYGWYKPGELEEFPEYGFTETETDAGIIHTFVGPAGENDYPEGYDTLNDFRYAKLAPNFGCFPIYRNFTPPPSHAQEAAKQQGVRDSCEPYFVDLFPNVIFTSEEKNEISLLYADLSAYVREMETKMIRGDVPIEASWDSYKKGLMDRGVDRYIELYQIAYDRWNNE